MNNIIDHYFESQGVEQSQSQSIYFFTTYFSSSSVSQSSSRPKPSVKNMCPWGEGEREVGKKEPEKERREECVREREVGWRKRGKDEGGVIKTT